MLWWTEVAWLRYGRVMVKHFTELSDALREFGMPLANIAAVWHIKSVVGGLLSDYRVTAQLIIAKRADGNPEIHIGLGSVSGFISVEEAEAAAGGRSKRPGKRDGTWRVDLPVDKR